MFRQARLERNVFLLVVGGVFVGNWVTPTVFESRATLLVSPIGAAETGGTATVRDDAIALLQDTDFLLLSADRIGLPLIIEQDKRDRPSVRATAAVRAVAEAVLLIPRQGETGRALAYLQRHFNVPTDTNERLILLSFTATDASFAQSGLQTIAQTFVGLHQRPGAGAQDAAPTPEQLAQAEAALDAFLATHDADALETQFAEAQARAATLREGLRAEHSATGLQGLAGIEADLADLRGQLDELQRLEDDAIALSAGMELGGAWDAAPVMTAGPVAISVVTRPTLPVVPIAPNRLRNLLHALWIGVVLAPIAGLIAQWIDHSLLFPEDLEQGMGVPVLGSEFAGDSPKQRTVRLQQICARLRQQSDGKRTKVWLITSAREGTAALPDELAQTLAEDATAQVLHLDLHVDGTAAKGFGNVILDELSLEDALRREGESNLWRLGRGAAHTSNPLFLASRGSEKHWRALRERFTDIIVSAPPVLDTSETVTVAGRCDAVLLVVQGERVRREVVARACEILTHVQTRVGGAVLTNRRTYIPRWLYTRI